MSKRSKEDWEARLEQLGNLDLGHVNADREEGIREAWNFAGYIVRSYRNPYVKYDAFGTRMLEEVFGMPYHVARELDDEYAKKCQEKVLKEMTEKSVKELERLGYKVILARCEEEG